MDLIKMMSHCIMLFVLRLVSATVSEQQQTSYGVLIGTRIRSPDNSGDDVVQFLGVPYGQMVERFEYPQGARKWTNKAKDATSMKPVCPQVLPNEPRDRQLQSTPALHLQTINNLRPSLMDQDEDCLYMNIYVPDVRSPPDLHTVVVVHGDEFDWNSGNVYNGSMLASYGRVIVVTINYRLGPFGFLASCTQDCAPACPSQCQGNVALTDIVVALEMLSQLVTDFGGMRDAITLLGWGSGAAAVNLMMTSPFAAPNGARKFKRAILLSGSALSPWAMSSNPQRYFYEMGTLTGCYQEKPSSGQLIKTDSEVRACMKTRDIRNMTAAARQIKGSSFLGAFAPIVDGIVVVNSPLRNIKDHGDLFQNIDLMIGLNTNDAYKHLSEQAVTDGIDRAERARIFRTMSRNLFQYHRTEIYDALVNEYTNWAAPSNHKYAIRKGVLEALNDALFVAPLIKTAQLHSTSSSSNTFAFVFNHESSSLPRGDQNRIEGAISGEMLPYILGYPLWQHQNADMSTVPFATNRFNQRDIEISRIMMRSIANFVISGDPVRPSPFDTSSQYATQYSQTFSRITWRAFSAETREPYVVIDTREPTINHYYRAAKVAFWNEFLPKLQASGKDADANHNILPDHFKKNSYFGEVRPFGEYGNMPFPLPPTPPPAPMPVDLQPKPKPGDGSSGKPGTSSGGKGIATVQPTTADYSTILSVTVAVGCALLVLNILIFAGIYHQRDKQKRNKKKMQLHYHSYEGYGPAQAHNMSSPMQPQTPMMPPAPPPPMATNPGTPSQANTLGRGSTMHDTDMGVLRPVGLAHHHVMHHQPPQSRDTSAASQHSRPFQQEQEPLLTTQGTGPRSSAGAPNLPPGVSPTCPRHGRAAIVAAAHHQTQSSVEEIQV